MERIDHLMNGNISVIIEVIQLIISYVTSAKSLAQSPCMLLAWTLVFTNLSISIALWTAGF